MRTSLSEQEFIAEIGSASRSASRLELQPQYDEPAEQATLALFAAGDRQPPTEVPGLAGWFDLVCGLVAAGVVVARVRIVEQPPTLYQQWLQWIGDWNVEAGERIGYLARSRAHEVGLLPAAGTQDWWLIDDDRLIVMDFDANGRRISTVRTTDVSAVERARGWWQLARTTCEVRPAAAHRETDLQA